MADNYTDIMKEIGCGDGFHIPVANEENKLIEYEIKELLQNKAKLLLINESLDNDLQEKKHTITNLTIQEAQNQKLIITNRKQYETEQQMLMIAQRENENISRENKTATKMFNELIDHQTKLQNKITLNEEHINKLRNTIEWGEETLIAWNNDLAKQNTDVNFLERYHLEDNNLFKNLEVQRQRIQQDVLERESILEQEINEFHRIERELEHTCSQIKQAQSETNRLIQQWETSERFLDSVQKEREHLVEKINTILRESGEMYDKMKENKLKYENYLYANKELEFEIEKIQESNNDLKLSNSNQLSENENLQSQILTAQIVLKVLGNQLDNERTKHRHMQKEQDNLKTKILQKEQDISKISDNVLQIKSNSMTQEEKLNELNKILDIQNAKKELLQSQKYKVLSVTYEVNAEITRLQSRIDMLINRIDLSRKEQIQIRKEKSRMKQSILKSKQELYNTSYKLETVRIHMSEVKETVHIEEMENIQKMLQAVNNEFIQTTHTQSQLTKQLKSAESEFRRITKEIEKNAIELEVYQKRVQEIVICNERGEKQIKLLEDDCQQNRIEEKMLKFKIDHIKKMMDNECEKVYSLAQQRDEISADINKRKAEVADTYERINAEKKLLCEEKSSAKRKLDVLIQYIQQRKNKYEIFAATMGNSEPACSDFDDQTSFTLSEHRIRLSREKLELQDVGDELYERVQKLQININAMENTVLLMNATNNCYKAGMISSHPNSDEKNKIILEETYDNLKNMCLQKKKTVKNLEKEIQNLECKYKTKHEELNNLNHFRDIKNDEYEKSLNEINDQMIKLNRANNRIQFAIKQMNKCDVENRSAFELKKKDIMVRMTKKTNNSVLSMLSEMSVRNIELGPIINQYISEKSLELPPVSNLLMNQIKSNNSLSISVTSMSSDASMKSYSYSNDSSNSSYSVVNLEVPSSYSSN